jgi:uncharacterized membrane protein YGL010W
LFPRELGLDLFERLAGFLDQRRNLAKSIVVADYFDMIAATNYVCGFVPNVPHELGEEIAGSPQV